MGECELGFQGCIGLGQEREGKALGQKELPNAEHRPQRGGLGQVGAAFLLRRLLQG